MKIKVRRIMLICALGFSLAHCGPKEFHEQKDFSNGTTESLPGTESKITNSTGSIPGSFISNNTVAIISNFNEKKLEYFGFCSGVRLSSYLILTAAHCISNIEKMRIVFGSNIQHSIKLLDAIFEIAEVKIHDNYQSTEPTSVRRYFDIALIKLKKPLPNNRDSYSLATQFDFPQTTSQYLYRELLPESSDSINLQSWIAGYGVSFHKNAMYGSTRFIGTINEAAVSLRANEYAQRVIMLSSESLPQACVGDSGGPLFVWRDGRYYVQAIAISIKDVESSDPFTKTFCEKESSYLNLDHFKTWISENARQL